MRAIVAMLAVVAVMAVVLWLAFLFTMRTKYAPGQRLVRRMNRAVANPRQLETAGKAGAASSVVRHVGRRSGEEYATPIEATPIDGGFIITLPYGTKADWVSNVLAAGHAVVGHDGSDYPVEQPEVIPMAEAFGYAPSLDTLSHKLFKVDQALLLHIVDDA